MNNKNGIAWNLAGSVAVPRGYVVELRAEPGTVETRNNQDIQVIRGEYTDDDTQQVKCVSVNK